MQQVNLRTLPFGGARLTATGLVLLSASILVGVILTYGATSDLAAFLHAAERASHGLTPYGPAPEWTHAYLYAPWLAVLLIPATWVPAAFFEAFWHALLVVALGAALWPLIRIRTLEGTLAATVLGTFGFHAVWIGHFEPLMICGLVYALPTRWGPFAIGVAASLKITPILLAVRYAGRGEWSKVGVSVGVAALLWAPALLFDRDGWGLPIGQTLSMLGYSPVAWAAVAILALFAAWTLARSRYGWLAATALWLAVMPRVLLYDVSALAVGVVGVGEAERLPSRRSVCPHGEAFAGLTERRGSARLRRFRRP